METPAAFTLHRSNGMTGTSTVSNSVGPTEDTVQELRRLREEKLQWEKEKFELKSQKMVLHRTVDHLNDSLDLAEKFHGRNSFRTSDQDKCDVANKDTIKKFVSRQLMVHHKFPHPSWTRYLPYDHKSICCKIIQKVVLPEGVSEHPYWKFKLVPKVNAAICEWRSNVNTQIRAKYMGELYYVIYIIVSHGY